VKEAFCWRWDGRYTHSIAWWCLCELSSGATYLVHNNHLSVLTSLCTAEPTNDPSYRAVARLTAFAMNADRSWMVGICVGSSLSHLCLG